MAQPGVVTALTGFARLLRDAGLEAGPGRLVGATRAVAEVDVTDPADFRAALRSTLVARHEDLPVFDAAFDLFWRSPGGAGGGRASRPHTLPLPPERAREWRDRLGLGLPQGQEEEKGDPLESSGYSARESLRRRDFAHLTHAEAEQVRRLLNDSRWYVAARRTRRLRPAARGVVDLRRTARRGIRSGGELALLMHRRPRLKRRPLVLMCDVSGSMESYSRFLLLFAHAVARREDVETFVFATRLTRITRPVRRRDVDQALDAVAGAVRDFSGGTRIGQALHEFNRRWARRVLGHGAVMVVISDGWDRGEPELLGREMAHLHRLCHRVVWLNPLLGSEGYEPVTRGMAAALPHCDYFIPGHSLMALEELGRLLGDLDRVAPRRTVHA
ncbi:MAG: vWA domain-containing protein [Candidatus Dormibacterales bacterium]